VPALTGAAVYLTKRSTVASRFHDPALPLLGALARARVGVLILTLMKAGARRASRRAALNGHVGAIASISRDPASLFTSHVPTYQVTSRRIAALRCFSRCICSWISCSSVPDFERCQIRSRSPLFTVADRLGVDCRLAESGRSR
jgi:hypothetical protein